MRVRLGPEREGGPPVLDGRGAVPCDQVQPHPVTLPRILSIEDILQEGEDHMSSKIGLLQGIFVEDVLCLAQMLLVTQTKSNICFKEV